MLCMEGVVDPAAAAPVEAAAAPALSVSAKQATDTSMSAKQATDTTYITTDIAALKAKIADTTAQYQQTAAGPAKDTLGDTLMGLKNQLGPMLTAARLSMKAEHDSHRTHLDQLPAAAAAAPVEAAAPAANVSAAAPSLSVSEKQTSYVNADITALRAKIAETTAMYQGALAGPAKDGLADTLMGLKNQVAPTLAAARVS